MSQPMDLEQAVVDRLAGHRRRAARRPRRSSTTTAPSRSTRRWPTPWPSPPPRSAILLAVMAGRSSAQDAAAAAGRRRDRERRPRHASSRRPTPPRTPTRACSTGSRRPSRPDRRTRSDSPGRRRTLPRGPPTAPPSASARGCPTPAPVRHDGAMTEARAGMLLVATPVLLDPNFVDTVVLLLDVDENGALGVVLNRPSPVPVAEVLADWGESWPSPRCCSTAARSAPTARSRSRCCATPTTRRSGSARSYGQLGVVDLDTPVELVDGTRRRDADLRRVRRLGRRAARRRDRGGQLVRRPGRGAGRLPRSTRPTCGATCCAASRASSPGTPHARSTRT